MARRNEEGEEEEEEGRGPAALEGALLEQKLKWQSNRPDDARMRTSGKEKAGKGVQEELRDKGEGSASEGIAWKTRSMRANRSTLPGFEDRCPQAHQ